MTKAGVKNEGNTNKRGNGVYFKNGNPGRQKGTPNKFTNLKQAFLDVFEQIEKESKESEVKSFYEWSIKNDKNRGLFYQLISKMLPSNVTIDGDLKLTYLVSEKFMPKDKKNGNIQS